MTKNFCEVHKPVGVSALFPDEKADLFKVKLNQKIWSFAKDSYDIFKFSRQLSKATHTRHLCKERENSKCCEAFCKRPRLFG